MACAIIPVFQKYGGWQAKHLIPGRLKTAQYLQAKEVCTFSFFQNSGSGYGQSARKSNFRMRQAEK